MENKAMTFIEFLASISGEKSPLPKLGDYNLNNEYPRTSCQLQLENLFGAGGTTVASITDNTVLTLGERSLYLKIAAFSSAEDCAKFLDYIYAAIMTKKPGHYWSLLIAIKQINDNCHNTLIKTAEDGETDKGTPSNKVLFKDALYDDQDKPIVSLVSLALHVLIKRHIEIISSKARVHDLSDQYRQQQITSCNELQTLVPNSFWRLKHEAVTFEQIIDANNAELLAAYNAEVLEKARSLRVELQEHKIHCMDPNSDECTKLITLQFKAAEKAKALSILQAEMRTDKVRFKIETAVRSNIKPSIY
jgi:hypothetical protein